MTITCAQLRKAKHYTTKQIVNTVNSTHNYVPPTKDPHADPKNINNTLLNAHYAKLRREQ